MAASSIRLTTSDRHRLYLVLSRAGGGGSLDSPHAQGLVEEIRGAEVLAPTEAPPDLVTMRSTVRITDLDSGEPAVYTVVYPDEADLAEGRISVLSPLGTAVLGQRIGDTVEVPVPAGARRVRVDAILFQPEAAGRYDL